MTPHSTIYTTRAGKASDDPVKARIHSEVERQTVSLANPLVLARIKLHPVPKGKAHE